MKGTCSLVVVAVFLSTVVSAGDLRIVGQNLSWSPTTQLSPQYLFGVENISGTDDPLSAWQLRIKIVPDENATGLVEFNSATEPPDYLLADRSIGIVVAFFGPPNTVGLMGDDDQFFFGVEVPPSGTNLLRVDFAASPDALGRFDIVVLPHQPGVEEGTAWFYLNLDTFEVETRDFENIPFGGGPLTVGSVTVVPEPSTIVLLTLGTTSFLCYGFWRRKRRRWQTPRICKA